MTTNVIHLSDRRFKEAMLSRSMHEDVAGNRVLKISLESEEEVRDPFAFWAGYAAGMFSFAVYALLWWIA